MLFSLPQFNGASLILAERQIWKTNWWVLFRFALAFLGGSKHRSEGCEEFLRKNLLNYDSDSILSSLKIANREQVVCFFTDPFPSYVRCDVGLIPVCVFFNYLYLKLVKWLGYIYLFLQLFHYDCLCYFSFSQKLLVLGFQYDPSLRIATFKLD